MNEVEYERDEEIKAMGKAAAENLKAILADHDAKDVAQLARSAYKYSDCGASVGALIYAGEDVPGQWVYGDDLRNLDAGACIVALSVCSIVEGVDQTTQTHVVNLLNDDFETPQHARTAYAVALDTVEIEAQDIWNETHGCKACAEHFGFVNEDGPCEGDDGQTPVWPECPNCKGAGSVI